MSETDSNEMEAAVALLVENYHEVRCEVRYAGGANPRVICSMPENAKPYVVVQFSGGLSGNSWLKYFSDSHQAARCFLGLDYEET